MPDPAAFDAFYRETRERLLVQAFLLTGDGAAARSIVVGSLAHLWARWDAAAGPADRETSARREVIARSRSPRRVRSRRTAPAPAAPRAMLEALALLSGAQRRVVALTGPSGVSLAAAGHILGIGESDAEHDRDLALERLRESLAAPAESLTDLLDPVAAMARDARWPPARRVRRAGRRQVSGTRRGVRRAAPALLALVVGSAAVLAAIDVGPARPLLSDALDRVSGAGNGPDPVAVAPSVDPSSAAPGEELLPETSMLRPRPFARAAGGRRWTEGATGDNSKGNGLVLPCQQHRYADPSGEAALVRRHRTAASSGRGSATAAQLTEASASEAAARRAYRRMVSWVGGCTQPRTQLVASRALTGAGDAGRLLVLRSWDVPVTTTVIEVGRTGVFTTTTATTTAGASAPDLRAHARLQAAAVAALCELDGAGACPTRPRLRPSPPPRTGEVPAMLSEVDLPPVSGVGRPWVGTPPAPARKNVAASSCDEASFAGRFRGARWQRARTRTFLVPQARIAPAFGLTETVGALPRTQAGAFVERVRSRLRSCSRRQAGTTVSRLAGFDSGQTSLTAWRLSTEVGDRRSVRLQMAVLRRGTAVAQVGFVPTAGASIGRDPFVDLARRALARLEALPAPRSAARGRGR